MEFGKRSDIDLVDFRFPTDPLENQRILKNESRKSPSVFYIGCTGWAMKEWVGSTYPHGTKPAEYLLEYGKQFNTIELNATHYRVPSRDTVQRWMEHTPADFRFCPKLPQSISHSRDLGTTTQQIREFTVALNGLVPKLGPCFLQLPPYFGPDKIEVLQAFITQWPPDIPLSIEFRHPDWFDTQGFIPAGAELLERQGIGTVITDVAGRRDVLHLRLTTPFAMVRFVGNDLHPTDYTRVEDWAVRLTHWFSQGLQAVYFFTHEPDNLKAPLLAAYMHDLARAIPSIETRGPTHIDVSSGNQLALF